MSKQYAKEHSLDIPHFSCIEFPLKVNNVDRALQMVGGKDAIIRSCQDEMANPLELRFTKNIYEHPVNAKLSDKEQILIKISVPKKSLEDNKGNIQRTLHQMHQEKKAVHITPLAVINKNFRFREMSDFQYQPRTSQFTETIDKSIHSLNYTNIKNLDFSQDDEPWKPEPNGQFELPPPPRFSSIPLPFNYQYKRNALAVIKEGKLTAKKNYIKLHSIIIRWQDEVPHEPTAELKQQLENFQSDPENTFFKDTLATIELVRKLFAKRPIWLRKHLESIIPPVYKQCLKYALPQVSYTYTKGPWRQAYIRLGVDPKSSPQYSQYQTEKFRVPNFNRTIPKAFRSELADDISLQFKFNGEELPLSLSFQLDTITDPDVVSLLQPANLREECDFHDGWYDFITMTRVRRLMRYKLRCIVDGAKIEPDRVDFLQHRLEVQEVDERDDNTTNLDLEDLDDDEEEELEEEYELDVSDANYKEILAYLEKFNPRGANEIGHLSGLMKLKDVEF